MKLIRVKFFLAIVLLCLSLEGAEGCRIIFDNVPSEEVLFALQASSPQKTVESHPPTSFFALKQRCEAEIENFLKILQSFGYYDAAIKLNYQDEFPSTTVQVIIDSGILYRFGSFHIFFVPESSCLSSSSLPIESLPLKICDAAVAQTIIDTETKLLDELGVEGYPLAKMIDKKIIVDKEAKQVYVSYYVDSGQKVCFGRVRIDGLNSVDEAIVQKKILWSQGDPYDPELLKKTDTYLQDSGLFSQVTIEIEEECDSNGELPICIYLAEVKHRHIGAGISYSTDESVGFIFQWDNENFCNRGEAVALTAEASEVIQRASIDYIVPDFYCPYQELVYTGEIKREYTRGYIEKEVSLAARIDRLIKERLSLSYGLKYEKVISTRSDNNHNYNLLSVPLYLHWDLSNDLFNPTFGTQIYYELTPYQNFFTSNIFFLKQEVCFTAYVPFARENIILASSCQFGSIAGQSRINIPAPKRFYAGGGNDLRGYAYKTVSPLEGTKPIGGRSYFIFQLEPRIRVRDKLYFITFFDCGNVYSQSFPSFDERLLRSVGFGFRYLTGVGPLRLDVAFPLDRRPKIDSAFQIYASIGQTF